MMKFRTNVRDHYSSSANRRSDLWKRKMHGDVEAGRMYAILIPSFANISITSPYALIFAKITIITISKEDIYS